MRDERFGKAIQRRPEHGLLVKSATWGIQVSTYSHIDREYRTVTLEYSPSQHETYLRKGVGILALLPNLLHFSLNIESVRANPSDATPSDLVDLEQLEPLPTLPTWDMLSAFPPPKLRSFESDLGWHPDTTSLRWFLQADTLRNLTFHHTDLRDFGDAPARLLNVESLQIVEYQDIPEFELGLQQLFRDCPNIKSCVFDPGQIGIAYAELLRLMSENQTMPALEHLRIFGLDLSEHDAPPFPSTFPAVQSLELVSGSPPFHPLLGALFPSNTVCTALKKIELVANPEASYNNLTNLSCPFQHLLGNFTREDLFPSLTSCSLMCGLGQVLEMMNSNDPGRSYDPHSIILASDETKRQLYYSAIIRDFSCLAATSHSKLDLSWHDVEEDSFEDNRLRSLKSLGGGEVQQEFWY